MFMLTPLIARLNELADINPGTDALGYPDNGKFEGCYSFSDPDSNKVHFEPFDSEDAVLVTVEWYTETFNEGIMSEGVERVLSRYTARIFFKEVRAISAEWI